MKNERFVRNVMYNKGYVDGEKTGIAKGLKNAKNRIADVNEQLAEARMKNKELVETNNELVETNNELVKINDEMVEINEDQSVRLEEQAGRLEEQAGRLEEQEYEINEHKEKIENIQRQADDIEQDVLEFEKVFNENCDTMKNIVSENEELTDEIRENNDLMNIYYKDSLALPKKAREMNRMVRTRLANDSISNSKQIKANKKKFDKLDKEQDSLKSEIVNAKVKAYDKMVELMKRVELSC